MSTDISRHKLEVVFSVEGGPPPGLPGGERSGQSTLLWRQSSGGLDVNLKTASIITQVLSFSTHSHIYTTKYINELID